MRFIKFLSDFSTLLRNIAISELKCKRRGRHSVPQSLIDKFVDGNKINTLTNCTVCSMCLQLSRDDFEVDHCWVAEA